MQALSTYPFFPTSISPHPKSLKRKPVVLARLRPPRCQSHTWSGVTFASFLDGDSFSLILGGVSEGFWGYAGPDFIQAP